VLTATSSRMTPGAGSAQGRENTNSAPPPGRLRALMRPPCASMIPLQMASPRPAPRLPSGVEWPGREKNLSKTRFSLPGGPVRARGRQHEPRHARLWRRRNVDGGCPVGGVPGRVLQKIYQTLVPLTTRPSSRAAGRLDIDAQRMAFKFSAPVGRPPSRRSLPRRAIACQEARLPIRAGSCLR